MLKIVSGEKMASIDRIAIKERGIPGETLMENAGQGVVQFILEHELALSGDLATILCGKGNNGGDGLVIARGLYEAAARRQAACAVRRAFARLLLAVFFLAEALDFWAFDVCAAWVPDGFVEVAAEAVAGPSMPPVATEITATATTKCTQRVIRAIAPPPDIETLPRPESIHKSKRNQDQKVATAFSQVDGGGRRTGRRAGSSRP